MILLFFTFAFKFRLPVADEITMDVVIEDFGHDEIRIENLQMKNSKE